MITNVERPHTQNMPADRVYSPTLLPRLQFLLAALADIDLAHEKSLDAVMNSPADDGRKDEVIASLCERHREQRALYVRELSILSEQMQASFG